jgi:hypothetical protein
MKIATYRNYWKPEVSSVVIAPFLLGSAVMRAQAATAGASVGNLGSPAYPVRVMPIAVIWSIKTTLHF